MDRYEVLDVIGSGGMATVWRAMDRELGRVVALKRPHPALPGSELHARFAREARYAAMVAHPNVVAVHDVGADERGPFLVMELVDAPSLAETMPSPGDVARIAADVAAGLAALHAGGVAHGDVKPANILVAEAGAKLTDFGIARAVDPDTTLTGPGRAIGTPAYAAPEVLAANDRSPAADVYSLGVVLTELLTGDTRRAGGTRTMPTDPRWAAVVGPALSARPADRPTARELAERLAEIAASSPAVADPAVTTPMPVAVAPVPPPTPSTHRAALGAFVAGLLVVGALVAFAAQGAADDAPTTGATFTSEAASDVTPTEPPATTGPEPSSTTSSTSTSTSTTSTSTSSTSTTSTSTTSTTAPPGTTVPTLDDARDRFATLVDRLPRSDLKKRDAEAMIDGVDDALRDAERDDLDEAADELDAVEARIERQVDNSDTREDLLEALDDIRELLGL